MPAPTKTQRNVDLIRDRKEGVSWRSLGAKYGISFARAREIFNRETGYVSPKQGNAHTGA